MGDSDEGEERCLFTFIITFSGVSGKARRTETDTASRQTAINPHISTLQRPIEHGTKTVAYLYVCLPISPSHNLSVSPPSCLALCVTFWSALYVHCRSGSAAVLDHGSDYIGCSSMSKAVMSSGVHPARRCRAI